MLTLKTRRKFVTKCQKSQTLSFGSVRVKFIIKRRPTETSVEI